MSHLGRLVCRDCGAEITGTDDGTGQPYCWDCDGGKDDEQYRSARAGVGA